MNNIFLWFLVLASLIAHGLPAATVLLGASRRGGQRDWLVLAGMIDICVVAKVCSQVLKTLEVKGGIIEGVGIIVSVTALLLGLVMLHAFLVWRED